MTTFQNALNEGANICAGVLFIDLGAMADAPAYYFKAKDRRADCCVWWNVYVWMERLQVDLPAFWREAHCTDASRPTIR
jgi:hypothetical protein